MNSKERFGAVMAGQIPDRVPINYMANTALDYRLKQHYGLAADDHEELRRIFGVDFRGAGAPYIGPKLYEDIPERGVIVDNWGIHRRWIEHAAGGYWDCCDFPLREADEEKIADWKMPSPDDYDYAVIPQQCAKYKDFAVFIGGPGIGDVINSTGRWRGMEQTLVDLIADDPAGLLLIRRRAEINLEIIQRTLEAGRGAIDFLWLGEDLGTQIAPIISLELFRKYIRPIHQKYIDLAGSFKVPVMMHSCGSSSWAFEDFIQMGIKAVDTLQPEARDMSPACLKKRFGGRLVFHGCISTAGPVATGTIQDTAQYCQRTLEIMMPNGGYCFAPTHSLQDNSPVENVIAMYDTAKKYGNY